MHISVSKYVEGGFWLGSKSPEKNSSRSGVYVEGGKQLYTPSLIVASAKEHWA